MLEANEESKKYMNIGDYSTSSSIIGGRIEDSSANNAYWEPVLLIEELISDQDNEVPENVEKENLRAQWNDLGIITSQLWDDMSVKEELDLQRGK